MADIDNMDELEKLVAEEEAREKALAEIRKKTAALKNDPEYRKKIISQCNCAFDNIKMLYRKIGVDVDPKTNVDEAGLINSWSIKSDARSSKRGEATVEDLEVIFDQLPDNFLAQSCNKFARKHHGRTMNCKIALKKLVAAGKLTQEGNKYFKAKAAVAKKK